MRSTITSIDHGLVHRYLSGDDSRSQHRLLQSTAGHVSLQRFVHGVDFIADRPIKTLFSVWSGWVLLSNAFLTLASSVDHLQALAWMAIGILVLNVGYRLLRGASTLDDKTYQGYLKKLATFPMAADNTDIDRRELAAITWPRVSEENHFIDWHAKQIDLLASAHQWDRIANLMQSIRERFPLNADRAHLSFSLMGHLYKLHAQSFVLRSADKKAILKKLLRQWLKQQAGSPSVLSGLECASFFTSLMESENLSQLGRTSSHNTAVFLSLNRSEQQRIVEHLLAGDRRSLFVLVSLLMDTGRPLPPDIIEAVLEKFMLSQSHDPVDQENGRQMASLLILALCRQTPLNVSPASAAWLCHLYGRGENIMRSLCQFYDDAGDLLQERYMNIVQHLLSRALEYARLTPVPSADSPVSAAFVFYYPFLLRPEIVEYNRVMKPFDHDVSVSAIDRKQLAIIGFNGDGDYFMTELCVEEFGRGHDNVAKVRFYLWLLDNFIREIATDSLGGDDDQDGIRGRILARIKEVINELSNVHGEDERGNKIDELGIATIENQRIGRNFTFFLLRGLLAVTTISPEKRLQYFREIVECYRVLQQEDNLATLFFGFHDVAEIFGIENGAVDLVLGWAEQLFARGGYHTNKAAFDLLVPPSVEGVPGQNRIEHALLTHLVTLRPVAHRDRFLYFLDHCPVQDMHQYLAIFNAVLPINNSEGPRALKQWLGRMSGAQEARLIGVLIFALHSPEYFAPYQRSRGIFKKKAFLFVDEVQDTLQVFGRSTDLNYHGNTDIMKQLERFGFENKQLSRLASETSEQHFSADLEAGGREFGSASF